MSLPSSLSSFFSRRSSTSLWQLHWWKAMMIFLLLLSLLLLRLFSAAASQTTTTTTTIALIISMNVANLNAVPEGSKLVSRIQIHRSTSTASEEIPLRFSLRSNYPHILIIDRSREGKDQRWEISTSIERRRDCVSQRSSWHDRSTPSRFFHSLFTKASVDWIRLSWLCQIERIAPRHVTSTSRKRRRRENSHTFFHSYECSNRTNTYSRQVHMLLRISWSNCSCEQQCRG